MIRARIIAAATAAVLAPAVGAPAARADLAVLLDGVPSPALQEWADASFVPAFDGVLQAFSGPCMGGVERLSPCADTASDRVWLSSAGVPLEQKRRVFSHELGHRFDFRVMTAVARDAFRALIGDWRPWFGTPRAAVANSPGEKFAEAYGLCFRRRSIARTRDQGDYGYLPSPRRHRHVCRLIRLTAAGSPPQGVVL